MQFTDLGLKAELLRAVSEQGYDTPTPIQQKAIPAVMDGQRPDGHRADRHRQDRRLHAAHPASPGQRPERPPGARSKTPRVLVLVPTRELAIQVEESVRTYGKHLPINSLAVFGGVGINPQIASLRRGVDILVATPGRLLDHVQQRTRRPLRASRSWSSTKPTACSTWASSATSARSSPCCRSSGRT